VPIQFQLLELRWLLTIALQLVANAVTLETDQEVGDPFSSALLRSENVNVIPEKSFKISDDSLFELTFFLLAHFLSFSCTS
jgi:hypothetical protein